MTGQSLLGINIVVPIIKQSCLYGATPYTWKYGLYIETGPSIKALKLFWFNGFNVYPRFLNCDEHLSK